MDTDSCIFKIQQFSIHDGPGIRTTLFFRGCPLSCAWCHNPESQGPAARMDQTAVQKVARQVMAVVKKDRIFYEESNGGVTFSGGEPLCRPDLLSALAGACRRQGIHTCLDTSGYAPPDILKKAVSGIDLVLYDIKLIDPAAHEAWTGVRPGPVLDNLVRLADWQVPLLLRFPLVPGITDTKDNLSGLISFVREQTGYRTIHILPFHRAGQAKYAELGKTDRLAAARVPGKDRIAQVLELFAENGFTTVTGG